MWPFFWFLIPEKKHKCYSLDIKDIPEYYSTFK